MRTATSRLAAPRFSQEELRGALRTGSTIGLWIGAAGIAAYAVAFYIHRGWIGVDAHAYWHATHVRVPYHAAPAYVDAFEYSPVFLHAIRPFGHLPFNAFFTGWFLVETAIFVALTRGVSWRWRGPVLLFCVPELCVGNLAGFFSVVLTYGLVFSEAWALPVLTKITPAGPGMLWFLIRGEWVKAARAIGMATLLTALSWWWQPHLWHEWWNFLRANSGGHAGYIAVRCLVGVILSVVAARSGRAWLLPAAFIICTPVNGGINKDLAMLPATMFLWGHSRLASRRNGSHEVARAA